MGVRRVRDAAFWGVPVGTPIAPGMKPRKGSPAKSAVNAMASPGGAHWPGGDWRKPASGGTHIAPTLPGNRPATGPSSHIRGPGAPGSWPSASSSRASKTSAAARFSLGASRGREAATTHRAAAAQHITGGDIARVNHSGQELKVVRAREWRGEPGYDLQTGSSSEHTTWFPASAVSKGRAQTLDDIRNQRGTPDAVRKPSAADRKMAGLSDEQLRNGLAMHGTNTPTGRKVAAEIQRRAAGTGHSSQPRTARGAFDQARVADVSRTLNTAANREAARQAVAKLTGPQLRAIARSNGVTLGSGWKVDRIREQLVESLAGRRLDSKALSRL